MTSNSRELNKQVLDRIANDPKFRDEILDDPKGAMERAGFVWETSVEDDVSGYGLVPTTGMGCGSHVGKRDPKPVANPMTTALTCTDPQVNYASAADPATATPPKPAANAPRKLSPTASPLAASLPA